MSAQITQPTFYLPQFRGRFSTIAEPAIEDLGAKDSKNIPITDGSQVADPVDGDPNGRLQPGTDLVTGDDSTMASDTGNYTKGANVTINDAVAGKMDFASVDSGLGAALVAGAGAATYEVIFTVSGRTAGGVRVVVGGTNGTTRSSDATFTEDIVSGATSTVFIEATSNGTDLQVDNVTVRLKTAFRIDMQLDRRVDVDAMAIINHNARDVIPANELESFKLYHDTDNAFAGSTVVVPTSETAHQYRAEEQTFLNYDGVNDVTTVSDAAAIDITYALTLFSRKKFTSSAPSDETIIAKWDAAPQRSFLLRVNSAQKLNFLATDDGSTVFQETSDAALTTLDSEHTYTAVYSGVDQTVVLLVDGVVVASTTTGSITTTIHPGTADLLFGMDGASENIYAGDEFENLLYNRALSTSEVLGLHNGGDIATADIYGSAAELITNVNDRTFAADSGNWIAQGTGGSTIAAGVNTITVGATPFGGGAIPAANLIGANYADGKTYAIQFDIVSVSAGTVTIAEQTGGTFLKSGLTAGTGQRLEFVTGASFGGIQFLGSDAGATLVIDNLSIVKIGAVAVYQPEGISNSQSTWFDRSTNSLDGTISGAETRNGPGNSIILIKFSEINAQFWFAEFNPDALTFVGAYKIGQWQLLKTFTPSLNPDVTGINEEVNHDGLVTVQKYGGGLDVNKRYGRRRIFTMNYSFLTQADKDSFKDLYAQTEKLVFPFSPNGDASDPEIIAVRWLENEVYSPPAFDATNTTIVLIEEV